MPQKKRRTAKQKRKTKTKTKTAHLRKIFHRTPTPYPFSLISPVSPVSPTSKAVGAVTTSSAMMKAVSRDGKNWHVDTDVNGVKKHANVTNLTNSQIMDILAYPAANRDLKTRLLEEFRNIPRPMFVQPQHQPQHQILAQNFSEPIIRMDGPLEEPRIQYIYKNGCSNKPVMLNKLSPLHEAKIVPDFSGEPIHLAPFHSLDTMKPKRQSKKRAKKGKKSGKNRK
jgi:hypothetical protein